MKQNRFQDIDNIQLRLQNECPDKGEYLYDYKLNNLKTNIATHNPLEIQKKFQINFSDLPISKNTISGLMKRNFIKMTEIQRCVMPHALQGRDIMGASRTGSGKTLSYLIPLIENLYLKKWTTLDGLGGLIILPTRELAIQVFEVFQSISKNHELSVALLIGGKDFNYEKKRIQGMNVIIATPGRLLQHIQESFGFNADNLQVLVLDEADMIMELGFQITMNHILKSLPKQRQTLVFSATLSKNINQLGKLTLKNPERIFLHTQIKESQQNDGYQTPQKLVQYYMVIELQDKLDVLFSFLKSHLKSKILIFFSSCKQVRFAYEVFSKLKPGLPLFELQGRQKQGKRMKTFMTFNEKKFGALFTTNIAARGLDIPSVDWIIQNDCPEDVQTYLHRVGRTARYRANGKAIIFLTPQEIKFIDRLQEKKLDISKLNPNEKKQFSVKNTLQSYVAEDQEIKYLAQKAFISYLRCVFLNQDKEVFDVQKIDHQLYSESMGLIQTPIIKFKQNDNISEEDNVEKDMPTQKLSKIQKLKEKIKLLKKIKKPNEIVEDTIITNNDIQNLKLRTRQLDNKKEKLINRDDQQDDNDFLKIKRTLKADDAQKVESVLSKRQLNKIKPDGHFGGKNKIFFNDKGEKYTLEDQKTKKFQENLQKAENQNLDYSKEILKKMIINQDLDNQQLKDRLKAKKLKKKIKLQDQEQDKHGQIAVLDFDEDQ